MSEPRSYEIGMKVRFDPALHKVTVTFRGRIITLPGQFNTHEEAVWAGEAYCHQNGWRKDPTRRVAAARRL